MMDFINEFEAYFPLEYCGIGEDLACFHVLPASQFTKQDFTEIRTILQPAAGYTKTEYSAERIRIYVDLSLCRKLNVPAEDVLEDIAVALACGGSFAAELEIGKLILNDGSSIAGEPDLTASAEPEPQNEERIIHGILLAMNRVQGIEKVIVNEE